MSDYSNQDTFREISLGFWRTAMKLPVPFLHLLDRNTIAVLFSDSSAGGSALVRIPLL
jgi:hypothetical protein